MEIDNSVSIQNETSVICNMDIRSVILKSNRAT